MITAQLDNLFQHRIGKHGIAKKTETRFAAKRIGVAELVKQKLNDGEYGYANYFKKQAAEDIISIKKYLKRNKWINTMVVVGIGGSDLGGRTIRQALAKEARTQNPHINVIFHGDSTDPNDISWLMDRISLRSTVFNIISKSGGTMETMAQYAFLKEMMVKERPQSWQKYFVFTTGRDGALRKEALDHSVKTFTIPEDVGGRFSVLTPVGLLPALAMGIKAEEMIEGAKSQITKFKRQPEDAVPTLIGWSQYLLYRQTVDNAVMLPYSVKLNEFGRWYRQLWAESLGKSGKGIMPIQAFGPADQHSQLQFYTQGEDKSMYWFIRVKDHKVTHRINHVDVPGLEYLKGKELGEILNIEQQATAASLTKVGRPNATLEIAEISPQSLGELFMAFMLAVTILGEFMGVNAFDQPGVEESKQMMYALLGREGFEEKLQELKDSGII